MDLPTITTEISTLPTQRPLITGGTDTINSRCPVCGRTFEDCICNGAAPAALAVRMFDDGSDACPLCGYWTCRCGSQNTSPTTVRHIDTSAAHTPLYDPETDASPWVPTVDQAIDAARKVLDDKAGSNIHNADEMIRAAVGLEMRLRALVAALDKEAGR